MELAARAGGKGMQPRHQVAHKASQMSRCPQYRKRECKKGGLAGTRQRGKRGRTVAGFAEIAEQRGLARQLGSHTPREVENWRKSPEAGKPLRWAADEEAGQSAR